MATEDKPNIAVSFMDFPVVNFVETFLPLDYEFNNPDGKVCQNIHEAREYANQQFERIVTRTLNEFYQHKVNIETSDVQTLNEDEKNNHGSQ